MQALGAFCTYWDQALKASLTDPGSPRTLETYDEVAIPSHEWFQLSRPGYTCQPWVSLRLYPFQWCTSFLWPWKTNQTTQCSDVDSGPQGWQLFEPQTRSAASQCTHLGWVELHIASSGPSQTWPLRIHESRNMGESTLATANLNLMFFQTPRLFDDLPRLFWEMLAANVMSLVPGSSWVSCENHSRTSLGFRWSVPPKSAMQCCGKPIAVHNHLAVSEHLHEQVANTSESPGQLHWWTSPRQHSSPLRYSAGQASIWFALDQHLHSSNLQEHSSPDCLRRIPAPLSSWEEHPE